MRRLSLVLSVSALVVLGVLLLVPVAGAVNPPEGSWAWSIPYVPADGPHAFRATVAGPGFAFYAIGDDWSGQWIVNKVDCAADSEGSTEWTDTRTGPDGTGATASLLATDKLKNLYVAGTDKTHGGDIYLVKYDPAGNVLWEKSWDGPAHLGDAPRGLAVTGAGTVYVAGTAGKDAGYNDAVLLKYTTAGRLKWKYVMSTALYDSFEGVAVDGKGNAYVTGQRNGTVGSATMVTAKIDPYGHRVWLRTVTGLGIFYSGDFIKVKGTGVYAGGTLHKWTNWPLVVKYSLAGKRVYAWTLSRQVNSIDDMTVDAKGRVVLIGTFETWVGGGPLTTAWVDMLKADGSGLAASGMYYADYGATQSPVVFHDVAVEADSTIYLAGAWYTNMAGTEGNALVARIPSIDLPAATFQMDRIWRFDGPATGVDEFWSVLIQPHNGIFAAGTEHGGDGWKAVAHRIQP